MDYEKFISMKSICRKIENVRIARTWMTMTMMIRRKTKSILQTSPITKSI